MDEKEILNMMLSDRIGMLLLQNKTFDKSESQDFSLLAQQVDGLMKRLSPDDRILLSQYMDLLIECEADKETYLYSCGLKDGIRLMKHIETL